MAETSPEVGGGYEVELRQMPPQEGAEGPQPPESAAAPHGHTCNCETTDADTLEAELVETEDTEEPYDPHQAMLDRYDEARDSAAYLHQSVETNILWGSILTGIVIVNGIVAATSDSPVKIGSMMPIELGLAGYNAIEGVRRARRAGRYERTAESIMRQIEQGPAEARALEASRANDPALQANQFDLEPFGTQRAMIKTFVAEHLQELGWTPPASGAAEQEQPTPPQIPPAAQPPEA